MPRIAQDAGRLAGRGDRVTGRTADDEKSFAAGGDRVAAADTGIERLGLGDQDNVRVSHRTAVAKDLAAVAGRADRVPRGPAEDDPVEPTGGDRVCTTDTGVERFRFVNPAGGVVADFARIAKGKRVVAAGGDRVPHRTTRDDMPQAGDADRVAAADAGVDRSHDDRFAAGGDPEEAGVTQDAEVVAGRGDRVPRGPAGDESVVSGHADRVDVAGSRVDRFGFDAATGLVPNDAAVAQSVAIATTDRERVPRGTAADEGPISGHADRVGTADRYVGRGHFIDDAVVPQRHLTAITQSVAIATTDRDRVPRGTAADEVSLAIDRDRIDAPDRRIDRSRRRDQARTDRQ